MNPYSLSFGKSPGQFISRWSQLEGVVQEFSATPFDQQVMILTGIRGSGKTVAMTEVSKRLEKEENWIVMELNPQRDILQALAAKLSSNHTFAKYFQSAQINLSFFGFGLSVKGVAPITDIEVAILEMLKVLKKKKKRVLITIDEVTNNKNLRTFISSFQIFVRQELPIFLLMTGLYENVNNLQNDKSLTFLYRATKIELDPLNIGAIANNYRQTFNLDQNQAIEMARLTKGYSYAFQVLGYLRYQNQDLSENTISTARMWLEDKVYEKLWSECSPKDQAILYAMAITKSQKISDIRNVFNLSTNEFNPYRNRLIKKGLVNGKTRGTLSFTLPFFDQYVLEHYNL